MHCRARANSKYAEFRGTLPSWLARGRHVRGNCDARTLWLRRGRHRDLRRSREHGQRARKALRRFCQRAWRRRPRHSFLGPGESARERGRGLDRRDDVAHGRGSLRRPVATHTRDRRPSHQRRRRRHQSAVRARPPRLRAHRRSASRRALVTEALGNLYRQARRAGRMAEAMDRRARRRSRAPRASMEPRAPQR